jgi:ribose 5-phosphate isomerase B
MVIYIGADHRGFELKEYLKKFLKSLGYEVVDRGNFGKDENDDYPDFAAVVARDVSIEHETAKGILICGSGAGMCIVANKFMYVRAALAMNSDQAFDARNDDDVNILCLAADYLNPEEARKIVFTWLQASFEGAERFRRRLNKIQQIEEERLKPLDLDTESS